MLRHGCTVWTAGLFLLLGISPPHVAGAQAERPTLTQAVSAVLVFRTTVLQDSTPVDLCSLRALASDSATAARILRSAEVSARIVQDVIPGVSCASRGTWDSRRVANVALSGFRDDNAGGATIEARWTNGEYSHSEEYYVTGKGESWYVDSYRQFRFLQELAPIPPPRKPIQ